MVKITNKQINEMLSIDVENLELCLKKHAEYLYLVGEAVSDMEFSIANKKDAYEISRAKIYIKRRNSLMATEGTKLSESRINSSVIKDAKLVTIKSNLNKLLHKKDKLKSLHKALIEKGSMMEQISFNRRKDIDFRVSEKIIKKSMKGKK